MNTIYLFIQSYQPWATYYFWAATIVSFAFLVRVPQEEEDGGVLVGNIMVALLLGWLFWPIFICAGLGINLRTQWKRFINRGQHGG